MWVQVDNRMRAWYQKDMTTGLLYICSLGEVWLSIPCAHHHDIGCASLHLSWQQCLPCSCGAHTRDAEACGLPGRRGGPGLPGGAHQEQERYGNGHHETRLCACL